MYNSEIYRCQPLSYSRLQGAAYVLPVVDSDLRQIAVRGSSGYCSRSCQGYRCGIIRLYVRGSILGYKRSKSNQDPNTSLIQIKGVKTKEEVAWYCGQRMAYIYKAKVKKNGIHYRCIWGKVIRPHVNSGVVRAKFKSNLPPRSMVHWI